MKLDSFMRRTRHWAWVCLFCVFVTTIVFIVVLISLVSTETVPNAAPKPLSRADTVAQQWLHALRTGDESALNNLYTNKETSKRASYVKEHAWPPRRVDVVHRAIEGDAGSLVLRVHGPDSVFGGSFFFIADGEGGIRTSWEWWSVE